MTALVNHVTLMGFYAAATGVFFAFLWKRTARERIRFFTLVFLSLFFGGLLVAWMMYPFPLGK